MHRVLGQRRFCSLVPAVWVALALASPPATAADIGGFLRDLVEGSKSSTGSEMLGRAKLSTADVTAGLKEALLQGAKRAIATLGKPDGFLGNPQVRIPMPESLQSVEQGLRLVRQDAYADEFIETMNHAAEEAVPKAVKIFTDAISTMSVSDAHGILDGPPNAATEYFRRTSTDDLASQFRPIVERATDKAGVTGAYKQLIGAAGPAAQLLSKDASDVDGYVTDKAVEGLFKLIEAEEKRIRENPVARTTDLLKKVFGS